jgi:hypothetical protein
MNLISLERNPPEVCLYILIRYKAHRKFLEIKLKSFLEGRLNRLRVCASLYDACSFLDKKRGEVKDFSLHFMPFCNELMLDGSSKIFVCNLSGTNTKRLRQLALIVDDVEKAV